MRALRHIAKSESKSHNSPDSNFRWIFYTLVLCCYKAYPSHFSQVSPKLKRIQHTKNYQNGSSGFGEICLVLFLWRDRYSALKNLDCYWLILVPVLQGAGPQVRCPPTVDLDCYWLILGVSSARRWPPSTLPLPKLWQSRDPRLSWPRYTINDDNLILNLMNMAQNM